MNKVVSSSNFEARGWHPSEDEDDWDIYWASTSSIAQLFSQSSLFKLHPGQLVNHFPNHYELTHKASFLHTITITHAYPTRVREGPLSARKHTTCKVPCGCSVHAGPAGQEHQPSQATHAEGGQPHLAPHHTRDVCITPGAMAPMSICCCSNCLQLQLPGSAHFGAAVSAVRIKQRLLNEHVVCGCVAGLCPVCGGV